MVFLALNRTVQVRAFKQLGIRRERHPRHQCQTIIHILNLIMHVTALHMYAFCCCISKCQFPGNLPLVSDISAGVFKSRQINRRFHISQRRISRSFLCRKRRRQRLQLHQQSLQKLSHCRGNSTIGRTLPVNAALCRPGLVLWPRI